MKLPKEKYKKTDDEFHFETECTDSECEGYWKDMRLIWSHVTDYVDDQGRLQVFTERLYQCDYCKTIKVV